MKKIILSIAMMATIAFTGCSSDDDNGSPECKTCENINDSGITGEVCDNDDGTFTLTLTQSEEEIFTITQDIPEGESIDDFDCSDLDDITEDFTGFDTDLLGTLTPETETPNSGSTGDCVTCTLSPLTTEYCDNGDGTVTLTTQGFSQTTSLAGFSFGTFIANIEASGFSCN